VRYVANPKLMVVNDRKAQLRVMCLWLNDGICCTTISQGEESDTTSWGGHW